MKNDNVIYTVRRIKKNNEFIGPEHGSDDGDKTLCGQDIIYGWFIVSNDFSGNITCKRCLKLLSLNLKERRVYETDYTTTSKF